MKETGKRKVYEGLLLVVIFAIFTCLVKTVDVKPLGVNGTDIGFSSLNCMLHKIFGVNMILYTVTDCAGLIPIFTALVFGIFGFVQLIKRKSLLKVDADILILGIYYIAVAILYIMFEMLPINYRPILINGFAEASYPSSTTLLVLCVMPTLTEQISRRCRKKAVIKAVYVFTLIFSLFTVVGRLLSGVHWFTDIIGSVIISVGLYHIYKGFVLIFLKKA